MPKTKRGAGLHLSRRCRHYACCATRLENRRKYRRGAFACLAKLSLRWKIRSSRCAMPLSRRWMPRALVGNSAVPPDSFLPPPARQGCASALRQSVPSSGESNLASLSARSRPASHRARRCLAVGERVVEHLLREPPPRELHRRYLVMGRSIENPRSGRSRSIRPLADNRPRRGNPRLDQTGAHGGGGALSEPREFRSRIDNQEPLSPGRAKVRCRPRCPRSPRESTTRARARR